MLLLLLLLLLLMMMMVAECELEEEIALYHTQAVLFLLKF